MKSHLRLLSTVVCLAWAEAAPGETNPTSSEIIQMASVEAKAPFIITNGYATHTGAADSKGNGCVIFYFTNVPAGQYAIRFVIDPGGDRPKTLLVRLDEAPESDTVNWTLSGTEGFVEKLLAGQQQSPVHYFQVTEGKHAVVVQCRDKEVRIKEAVLLRRPTAPAPARLRVVGFGS